MEEIRQKLIKEFYHIGGFRIGNFKLKTGALSPFYLDLRKVPSYPICFDNFLDYWVTEIKNTQVEYDVICGVPYGAVSWATGLAMKLQKPLILMRKEAKKHGTGQLIEGNYKDKKCILIEDVVTSGSSMIEAINMLKWL